MINYKKINRYFSISFARYILGRFYTIRKIYKILNKILFTSKILPDVNNYITFNSSQNELLNDLTVSGVSKKIFLKKEINNFILDNYKNSRFISEKIFKQDRYEFKNFNDFKKSKIILPFFELENKDFKVLFDKISKSKELLEIAKQSEHPRAFEVVGQLIGKLTETNKELMGLHKTKKELSIERGGDVNVNNAVFVGSTAELQKLLKSKRT